MFSIFIALLIFFFTFVLQLVIVRILRLMNIHVFFSFFIYLVGLVMTILSLSQEEFLYTSTLIYILLTLLLMTASPIPLLGGSSTAYLIVWMLEKEKKMSKIQMYRSFDEKKLILTRLDDLVDVGLVRRRGNTYAILRKGLLISQLIAVCGLIMGLRRYDNDS
ncbi:MAG: hypothetical protein HYT11_00355 [Candidatus Levybacteria bacterium]|nr:hypothetical protein [Candidatus Levybacteria bacterium]